MGWILVIFGFCLFVTFFLVVLIKTVFPETFSYLDSKLARHLGRDW